MKCPITAAVLTKNEEKNIKKCLKSLAFCKEIIIIDDFSTDKTTEIAEKFNAKIFKRKLNGNFASQRNFALSKAKNNLVLFVDADEKISKSLSREIFKKIQKNQFNGFYFKRKLNFLDKTISHGEVGNTRLLRLAFKNKGKWKRKVHEFWSVKLPIGELRNPILHLQNKSIKEIIKDINFYSKIHASENLKEKKKANFFFIILAPLGKFLIFYIFKLGFLDGIEGFILSILMSFHSFLSWVRLWLIQKHPEKFS